MISNSGYIPEELPGWLVSKPAELSAQEQMFGVCGNGAEADQNPTVEFGTRQAGSSWSFLRILEPIKSS